MKPNVPHDYLYRTDSDKNLRSIAKKGLLCVGFTSVKWQTQTAQPYETEVASLAGLTTPPEELMYAPRLYFFLDEDSARDWNRSFSFPPYHLRSVLRFSRLAPRLKDENLFFYDGCFSNTLNAVYAVCPGAQVNGLGIEPEHIEVLTERGWIPIVEHADHLRAEVEAETEAEATRQAVLYAATPTRIRVGDGGRLARLLRRLGS
jgi:hypothetical protein